MVKIKNSANGLKFRKLDLHTHTPASKCYKDKTHTAEQIVQTAIDNGLDGIAITDHNSADWIDKMREAARHTSLVVFPGVEVSMPQYHVVILFDPTKTQDHIVGFLGAINIQPDMYGEQDTVCEKGLEDVIHSAHRYGGLVVLAHIDNHKGLYKEFQKSKPDGKISLDVSAINIFKNLDYDAVECTEGKLPWNIDESAIKRSPAYYRSSDNPDPIDHTKHSMLGIGKSYSWFRMEEMNIEGLRQCFTDYETRINQMEEYQEQRYPRIISLEVGQKPTGKGDSPKGYFGYKMFHFHQGLNGIIGGRGVGKSTLIEFIRYVLNQPPYPNTISYRDFSPHQKELYKEHNGKIRSLLGADNPIKITYELTSGDQYEIKRAYTGNELDDDIYENSTLICTNIETKEIYGGDIARLFPLLAYSQTEIVSIARHTDEQLRLIDQFVEGQKVHYLSTIQNLLDKLTSNDSDLIEALDADNKLSETKTEVDTAKGRLKELNNLLDSDIFQRMKSGEDKKLQLSQQINFLNEYLRQVEDWQRQTNRISVPLITHEFSNDESLNKLQVIVTELQGSIGQTVNELISTISKAIQDAASIQDAWLPEFERLQSEYMTLLEGQGGNQQKLNRERTQLEQRVEAMEMSVNHYEEQSRNLEQIRQNRRNLLAQLEEAYKHIYELRQRRFEEISFRSGSRLRLTIKYADNRSKYKEELVSLLKGSANPIPVDIREKIAEKIIPSNLVEYVLENSIDQIASSTNITRTLAERVLVRLINAEDFRDVLRLQYMFPLEDMPKIEYNKGNDITPRYAALDDLSIGQKSTALIIIALVEGDMPILIDQPEDALDIRSVWDDVAKPLRRTKDKRQFILTTHNSTVAVGADADQFFILDGNENRASVKKQGSIDNNSVKEEVLNYLEGGVEPYELKQRKYNIKKNNV